MRITSVLPFVAALYFAGSTPSAQDSVVVIGGAGSFGSNGSSDPGTLDDGITEASARFLFHLDTLASQLTLTVDNTSKVLPGIPNPVLTDIFFNVPASITGISIGSQNGSGGATAAFVLNFDSDLGSNPNPNGANGFGAYSVHLTTPGSGVQGGIANPLADTWGTPPGSLVIGPVTFVLDLTGDLTGLTASSFTSLLSVNPPGSQAFVAAAKFQSGGVAGSSGFISPGSFCPVEATTTNIGGGCGASTLSTTPPFMGQNSTVSLTNAPASVCGTVLASPSGATPTLFRGCLVMLKLNQLMQVQTFVTDANGEYSFEVPISSFAESPQCCGATFVIQGALFGEQNGRKLFLEMTNAVQITLGS